VAERGLRFPIEADARGVMQGVDSAITQLDRLERRQRQINDAMVQNDQRASALRAKIQQSFADFASGKMKAGDVIGEFAKHKGIEKEISALERDGAKMVKVRARIEEQLTDATAREGARRIAMREREEGRMGTGAFRGAVRAGLQGTGLPLPFVTGGVSAIVGGLAGAAAAVVVRRSIADTIDWSNSLKVLQREIGGTLQQTIVLSGVAEKFGVDTGKLTAALVAMREATSSDRAAFAQLGVSLTDASGRARPEVDVLNDVRLRLSMARSETERYTIAKRIFAGATEDILPLLNAEQGAVDATTKKLEANSKALTEAALRARDADVRFKDLGDRLGEFLRSAGAAIITPFTNAPVDRERVMQIAREHGGNATAISNAWRQAQQEANDARLKIGTDAGAVAQAVVEAAPKVDELTRAFERLGLQAPAEVGKATAAVMSLGQAVAGSSTGRALDLARMLGFDDASIEKLFQGLEDVVGQSADRIREIFRQRAFANLDQLLFDQVVKPTEDAYNTTVDRLAAIDERLQRLSEKGAHKVGLSAADLAEQTRLMAERESATGSRRLDIMERLAELRVRGAGADGGAPSAADEREKAKLLAERGQLVTKRDALALDLERRKEVAATARAELDAAVARDQAYKDAIARHSPFIARVHEQRDAVNQVEAAWAAASVALTSYLDSAGRTVHVVPSSPFAPIGGSSEEHHFTFDITNSDRSLSDANVKVMREVAAEVLGLGVKAAVPFIRRGLKRHVDDV
jgi:transposase-like protein